jgi:outer membrane protein W
VCGNCNARYGSVEPDQSLAPAIGFANFNIKQIFLNTTASLNGGVVKAKTALNPTVVVAGIGYRF